MYDEYMYQKYFERSYNDELNVLFRSSAEEKVCYPAPFQESIKNVNNSSITY